MILAGYPTDPQHRRMVYLYRPPCKSWACSYCAKKKKNLYALRIYHGILIGNDWHGWDSSFVTLTSHERLKTFHQTAIIWPKVWKKFSTRLKREYGKVEYASVPEKHADGRLHVHLVMSRAPIETWVKDNLRASGGGYIADVKPVKDAALCAFYVSKYIGKSLAVSAWPARFRRIRFSHNWPEMPRDDAFSVEDVDWSIASKNAPLQNVVDHFEERGLRVKLVGTWGGMDYDTFFANQADNTFKQMYMFDNDKRE
jgi:hypothetical protein